MSNIWIAAADNKIQEVQSLIESGSYTANSQDPNGYTPIHAAVSYGHLELLRYLISKGGNINIQDTDGDTPLHHAESVDVAKVLVEELGADYKIKNKDGLTPRKYQEEEDEFPELVEYFTALENIDAPRGVPMKTGTSAFDESDLTMPNGEQVKFVLSKEADNDLGNEDLTNRRAQIEKIIADSSSEQEKDEKLREYVMGVLSDNLQTLKEDDQTDSQASKRRK